MPLKRKCGLFRVVQNYSQQSYFRRFYGGRSPQSPPGFALVVSTLFLSHLTKNMILFQGNQPPILATPFPYLRLSLQKINKRDLICCSSQCQLSYKIQKCLFLQQTPVSIQSPKIKLLIWNHQRSPACQILETFPPTLIKLIHERSNRFFPKQKYLERFVLF